MELIVAHDENFSIGFNGEIPWNIKQDRKRFQEITKNRTIVMGRKTYESIGHPLPSRRNVVISKTMKKQDGIYILPDPSLVKVKDNDIMIIGGEQIYKYFMRYITIMHVTVVHGKFKGDTFFPKYDIRDWRILEEERLSYWKYLTLERK